MAEPAIPKARRPTATELGEPVSLYPLDPDEALAALLKVDPKSAPVEEVDGE